MKYKNIPGDLLPLLVYTAAVIFLLAAMPCRATTTLTLAHIYELEHPQPRPVSALPIQ